MHLEALMYEWLDDHSPRQHHGTGFPRAEKDIELRAKLQLERARRTATSNRNFPAHVSLRLHHTESVTVVNVATLLLWDISTP